MNNRDVTLTPKIQSLIIVCVSLAIQSCSIMSKKDCLQGNWQQAGYTDATRGNTTSKFENRTKACAKHGIESDKQTYLIGYKEGVTQYCRVENAIDVGTRNDDYRGICPADQQAEFLEHYILGLRFASNDVSAQIRQTEFDLDNARYRRAKLDEGQDKKDISKRINSLSSKLDNLRTKQLEIKRKILRWQTVQ